jgi:hypothetical protein
LVHGVHGPVTLKPTTPIQGSHGLDQ